MSKETGSANHRWYENLSILRWIFAIFGILIMLFAGGCSLFIMVDEPNLIGNGGGFVILLFGGMPFLVGLLIWWLAAKVGRKLPAQ